MCKKSNELLFLSPKNYFVKTSPGVLQKTFSSGRPAELQSKSVHPESIWSRQSRKCCFFSLSEFNSTPLCCDWLLLASSKCVFRPFLPGSSFTQEYKGPLLTNENTRGWIVLWNSQFYVYLTPLFGPFYVSKPLLLARPSLFLFILAPPVDKSVHFSSC